MTDLTDLRQQIDEIDARIVELYEKRMEISGQVAQYKIETGKKVFDKARVVSAYIDRIDGGAVYFFQVSLIGIHGIKAAAVVCVGKVDPAVSFGKQAFVV